MKIYKVLSNIKYLFDGNSEMFIVVKKETKDIISGLEVDNFRGNYGLVYNNETTEKPITGRKVTIIKANVAGWTECIDVKVSGGDDE